MGVNVAAQAESHYFARNPIRKLADFNGKKLRVNATPAERARMQAFGATAVPMGLAEMITSLQNGVIDGTMSGISIYVNFNLQTVSKTITETNDTLLVSFGAMSKPWLDKLPADLRKIVVDEARGLQAWAIKQSDDEKVALRAKWIERGGEIIHAAGRRHGRAAEAPEADRRGHHQVRSEPQGFLRKGAGDGREILTGCRMPKLVTPRIDRRSRGVDLKA